MKSESRIFNGIALFAWVIAVVYGIWTSKTTLGFEWIGTTALVLTGGLCFICGAYFAFVARRIDPRPEDREDAEIDEGAGELGFFSPGSYWPLGVALSVAISGLGIVFWMPWLMAIGATAILLSVGGFVFEYYYVRRSEH